MKFRPVARRHLHQQFDANPPMKTRSRFALLAVTASAFIVGCGERRLDIDELTRNYGELVLAARTIELRDKTLTLIDPQLIDNVAHATNGQFALFSRLPTVRVDLAMLLATPRVDPIPSEAAVDYQQGDIVYCHLGDEGVPSTPETGEFQSIKVE